MLDPPTQANIQMVYRRSVRSSNDPFKKAVYCLLARCDFNDNHPDVIQKTDDYIWFKVFFNLTFHCVSVCLPLDGVLCIACLQLCQVELDSADPRKAQHIKSDKMTFSRLQSLLIDEYGELILYVALQPIGVIPFIIIIVIVIVIVIIIFILIYHHQLKLQVKTISMLANHLTFTFKFFCSQHNLRL